MKKQKLALALWENANPLQYHSKGDTSGGFWLYLRNVEQEEGKLDMEYYSPDGKAAQNAGLYVWGGTGGGCNVELNAHEIHSAKIHELEQLTKWLKKYQSKIERADIPRGFGLKETLILTLRGMGIKEALVISPAWNTPSVYKLVSLEEGLSLKPYAAALATLEGLRQLAWGDLASPPALVEVAA